MQGKFSIGAILVTVLAPSTAIAAELPQRLGCQRGDAPQQVQRVQQRQQQAQQQQRKKTQGCPVTRTIPSVVDPTPTFLL